MTKRVESGTRSEGRTIVEKKNPFYGGIPTTSRHYEVVAREIPFPISVDGIRILDVGAGCSNAIAVLLSQGADAYALDTRYPDFSGMEDDARQYALAMKKYEDRTF